MTSAEFEDLRNETWWTGFRMGFISGIFSLLVFAQLWGCAIGTVTDRQLSGYALGHAEIQRCRVVQPVCDAHEPAIKVCDTIKGGSFSSGFAGVLEAAVAALAAWLTL